jgi:hypothetical protein
LESWQYANETVTTWASAPAENPMTVGRLLELFYRTVGARDVTLAELGHGANTAGEGGPRYLDPGARIAALRGFMAWYHANADMDPIELAGRAYQRLVTIHPFPDANGRVAALVANWILLQRGLPAIPISRSRVALFTGGDRQTDVEPTAAVDLIRAGLAGYRARLREAPIPPSMGLVNVNMPIATYDDAGHRLDPVRGSVYLWEAPDMPDHYEITTSSAYRLRTSARRLVRRSDVSPPRR